MVIVQTTNHIRKYEKMAVRKNLFLSKTEAARPFMIYLKKM
jgi:hypothetical protein